MRVFFLLFLLLQLLCSPIVNMRNKNKLQNQQTIVHPAQRQQPKLQSGRLQPVDYTILHSEIFTVDLTSNILVQLYSIFASCVIFLLFLLLLLLQLHVRVNDTDSFDCAKCGIYVHAFFFFFFHLKRLLWQCTSRSKY